MGRKGSAKRYQYIERASAVRGPQITSARKRETEKWRADWEKKKETRKVEMQAIYGDKFESFDDIGMPVFKGSKKNRPMRAPELVQALERALHATGDPVFDDALRALKAYGLDGEREEDSDKDTKSLQGETVKYKRHKEIFEKNFSDLDQPYLIRMRQYVEMRGFSPHAASEIVASEMYAPGSTFDIAADRIRRKFSIWKKRNFKEIIPDALAGDLGYKIAVSAVDGVDLAALTKSLANKGEEQPATRWWRCRFREGSVAIRYLGKK